MKGAHTVSNKPRTIDEYLAGVSEDKRAALSKLRQAIKAAAPKAEERVPHRCPSKRARRLRDQLGDDSVSA